MDEHRDVYAYFWVEGFDCAPDEISKRLGIAPSKVHLKGEPLAGGKRIRTANSWEVLSPLARGSEVLDSYVEALLNLLEPRAAEIHALASECEVGINCVGYFFSANPGFHFSREVLHRLSAMCVSVDFDLYCYCAKSESEAQP